MFDNQTHKKFWFDFVRSPNSIARLSSIKHWKTSFEKTFCVGEYAEYEFDQQRLIWYVFRLCDMVFS